MKPRSLNLAPYALILPSFALAFFIISYPFLDILLTSSHQVSRFGIRELERILFDMFAMELIDAKDSGATRVQLAVGENGEVVVSTAT